jgi:hypothetical protein
MRRFHSDHEGAMPESSLIALWRCDETSTATGLLDSAFSAAYTLVAAGSNALANGIFTGASTGARTPGTALGKGWFESASASSAHNYLGISFDWLLNFWYTDLAAASTVCFIESSVRESPVASADLMALGVYGLADGSLRLQWDLSTTSLAHTLDIPGALPKVVGAKHNVAISKWINSNSNTFANVLVTVDGNVVASTQMFRISPAAGVFSNDKWVVGASKRWGTNTGTSPAFTYVNPQISIDDISFWAKPAQGGFSLAKHQELFGNGVRPWNERRVVDANNFKCFTRVLVEDSSGAMIDLSALYGNNWIKDAVVDESVEEPVTKAAVRLSRYRGPTLNLSPLSQTSVLNLDASSAFVALLELRRKIRIETAMVPAEWKIQGWEWAPSFEGFIDSIGWESDYVHVAAIDKMAPLMDKFQLDPRAYDYYASPTLAETHIQTVITNNVPSIWTGSSTLTFGYKGGTPLVYTPASSGWVLNYDDTPSGQVNEIVQSVADQIGWDFRYKWFDPWQEYLPTFFAPPRNTRLDIADIRSDASGFIVITFRTNHGLTEDQAVTIAGTTNFNGSTTVQSVLSYNKIQCFQTSAAAAETVGTVTYGVVYTFADTRVLRFDEVKKDVSKIRNVAVVKYRRDSTTVTLPITGAGAGVGGALSVGIAASAAFVLKDFQTGETFTITGANDANANGTFTIASISGGVLVTNELIAAGASATTGILQSEYMTSRQVVSMSTPSINKYGLRECAMYEASTGNIDTDQEANSLAAAIVNDLAEPTAAMTFRVKAAPWLELHDVITLSPDAKQRWTTAQNMAITGLKHHFEAGQCYTEVAVRNATPTLGTNWVELRLKIDNKKPALPNKFPAEELDGPFSPRTQSNIGHAFSFGSAFQAFRGNGGRRRLRMDMMEVHLSTACATFIPSASSTLAGTLRGHHMVLHHDALGQPITPGTTYYVRFRNRDVFGNVSKYTGVTPIVARFASKPPAAKVFLVAALSSKQFRPGNWAAYPFNNTSFSPGFDNYTNFQLGNATVETLPFFIAANFPGTGPSTYAFRMPCDGTVEVEARVGLRNGGDTKSVVVADYGVMRIGSSLAGSSGSVPVLMYPGFIEGTATVPGRVSLASTNVGTYIHMNGTVSAHSGDYLAIGINAVDGVLFPCANGLTGGASTSWAKFTVVSQD